MTAKLVAIECSQATNFIERLYLALNERLRMHVRRTLFVLRRVGEHQFLKILSVCQNFKD